MPELGDGPIDKAHHETMNLAAAFLDQLLNGSAKGADRKTGFVLMVFDFGTGTGRCNYISNTDRKDVVTLLKHQLARFEGQPDVEGHA